MNRTTTKVRTFKNDNDYLVLLALKVSVLREKKTNTAEVLHEIIATLNESGNTSIDTISERIALRFEDIIQPD